MQRELYHSGQLAGHQAVVVGAGASGAAAARLLSALGASVRFLEKKPAAVSEDFKAAAERLGFDLRLGEHRASDFADADLVVLSPGVRKANLESLLAGSRAQVLSELELASWFVDKPIVAVTGTNGKTTTVMLVSHLLAAMGNRVFTGGNIGTPLSEYVLGDDPADVIVIEASSFQLQLVKSFRPRVGLLLNFSANHLDWHADIEEYLEAKLRLFAAQRPEDLAILPEDLKPLLAGRRFTRAQTVYFTPTGRFTCPRLLGVHNQANMEAAYLACQPFGATPEVAAKAFADFAPPSHRLQKIGEKNGVTFVDDSKATTVTAMAAAVAAFDRPVLLLCGGVFKGGDLEAILPGLLGKVKAVGLFGASREVFEAAWSGKLPLFYEPRLADAVTKLNAQAAPGDVVLLSPATASFDQYTDYKARGRDFQAAFAALPGGPAKTGEDKP